MVRLRLAGLTVAFLFCTQLSMAVHAQPKPGSLYREYMFTNSDGDAGGAIRVGGKRGESYPDRGSDFGYINAWIDFPHSIDLEEATHAEVFVEKILSHNGTHGLAIQWNDSDWLALPAPATIDNPSHDFYHHTCITIPLDLRHVSDAPKGNRFRLRVSPEQSWNWPQHLIYGVHLRVYYNAEAKSHVAGEVWLPNRDRKQGQTILDEHVDLAVKIPSSSRRVDRVDYLGHYEGVNWAGDGVYRRWHYFYYHGQLTHHLSTSVSYPYRGVWDTSWVPDQETPISVCARIIDDAGLIYLTPALEELRLKRKHLSVELCKPFDVPDNWVTRGGEFTEKVKIVGDLTRARAARLDWSSWSPGYMHGLIVNGAQILDSEGPRYRYYDHHVPIEDLTLLKSGINEIGTGKTPLHDGKMVHGMEVNWPGIQLLIQYSK